MNPDLGKTSGLREIKRAIVVSQVDDGAIPSLARGLRIFLLAERLTDEPIRVRIAQDDQTDVKVDKVNSLMGKTVNVVIYRMPWSIGNKRGIVNYLQSIEENQS